MKVKIIIFFQIFVLCSCLKTTSIDKFKQKYDWEISEGEFLYVTSNTHMYYYEFHYQDKTYEASANSNAGDWYSRHKYNYQIIFDKKNPGKNHIVLFQYPIIKEPKIFEGTGKIIWIRTVKHKVCIKYEFAIISPTGDDVWKSESVEFLPIEYYESLQKIKNNNLTLTIFITRLKDRVYPWIDRTVLDD
jgi:hypothetical protein